ncbi:MAG: hypothetical protein JXA57_03850 [Armatimonadetes bacterium]|nr:hypothetical protein [Armatimonadota bacterium]
MFAQTGYPRVAMLWAPLRGTEWDSLADWARHDLVMVSAGQLGLQPDREPRGLAAGFTPASVQDAKRRVAELRRLNPDIVILGDNSFYELDDEALPEDHPWWLRLGGERQQFWPGTHRMDWYNPEYQAHVIKRSLALLEVGVDGLFFDNLRDEPEPWKSILGELRKKIGEEVLLVANVGYQIDEYDWVAPYLNGFMYESGWSHERTDWDDCIHAMQHTASLFRTPVVSIMERFEEVRSRAGWPTDSRRGQRPEADPAARRWSLCYSLVVGDYYYIFSDNTSHRHDWYSEYDVRIGLPKKLGERLTSHVWQREYERALVVVNLPGADQEHVVQLESAARDSLTGKSGKRFVVPPGDGRILVLED